MGEEWKTREMDLMGFPAPVRIEIREEFLKEEGVLMEGSCGEMDVLDWFWGE